MAHLITGQGSTDHITSEDIAALNASILGDGTYIAESYGDALAATLENTNKLHIAGGCLIMKGRQVIVAPEGEDLTLENGTQGQKRTDLVVMRYEKSSGNIETAELKVIKGTPTTGTPEVPSYVDGDTLIEGATVDEAPLYTVSYDGLTVGTPALVAEKLPTYSSFRDSISRLAWTGVKTVQVNAGAVADAAFTFTDGLFDAAPWVIPVFSGSAANIGWGSVALDVSSRSAAGCTVKVLNESGSRTTVYVRIIAISAALFA